MSKIEIGRYSEQLRRMFGMAGVEMVAADLSPEISPVIVLEQPDVELLFLKSVRQIFSGDQIAAAAGFPSVWRLRNPAASGVIAVVHVIEMTANIISNLAIRISTATTDFAVPVDTAIPDPRWNALGVAGRRSTAIITSRNDGGVPSGDTMGEARRIANTVWRFDSRFPLLPGVALDFGSETDQVNLRMYAEWTERAFPNLER